VIPKYVLDSGALVAAERAKPRVTRFFRLAHIGRAHLVVPYPVVAEWWRGRGRARATILAATSVAASLDAAKAAGVALSHLDDVDAKLTIDAIVMATAALLDGVVITADVGDFERLSTHFPGVVVLSV
jgi:hypothetical protein